MGFLEGECKKATVIQSQLLFIYFTDSSIVLKQKNQQKK